MVNLGPSRLLSSPGAAALFVASSPSTSSGNSIANPALAPHQKVMRDELVALKKKMSEVMGKHKSARKEVCTMYFSLVIEFLLWGSKLVRFLAKIRYTLMKLFYFVKRHNAESTKIGPNIRS